MDSSSLSSEISVGRLKTPTNASLANLDLNPCPELSTDYCVSGSLYYYVLIMQNIRLPTKKTLAQLCLFWFVLVFLSKAQNRVVVETCGRVTDT